MLHWTRKRNQIYAAVRSARSGSRLLARRAGHFDDAEVETAKDVRAARLAGRRVSARVIRAIMRRHVNALHAADKAVTFKASNRWLGAFCNRFAFAHRRATNRKSKPVAERLPAVRRYIARLARRLARHVRAPIVGPLQPPLLEDLPVSPYPMGIESYCRVNVDQSPFEFDSDMSRTYCTKGNKAVHVASAHGQHKESRFGTFQILVNLSGIRELQPKLVIVFRGQGRVKQQELDAYDKRVIVYFQRKAWMDDALCLRWLHEVYAPYEKDVRKKLRSACDENLLMFVDGLSGQTSPAFIKSARTYNTLVHIGPAGTTDLTQVSYCDRLRDKRLISVRSPQVIDRGIGRKLKERFRLKLDDWLLDETNYERFTSKPADGGLTVGQKRVLVTSFAADAWEAVVGDGGGATIVKCAQQCGAMIGLGGKGIEFFRLPNNEPFEVDFDDVGDNFADNSDDDFDDADDIPVRPASRRRAEQRPSNDDDDGDDDAVDDESENADSAASDSESLSMDSDCDGDRDDGDDDDDDNVLIAPAGFVLIAKADEVAFDLASSTFVGKELMLRNGERAAPRRATIVRQATRKDKETNSNNNYAIKYNDDNSVLPMWLRNREYGVDWSFIEQTVATDKPLCERIAHNLALETISAPLTESSTTTNYITNYFENARINNFIATPRPTLCTASCSCVGTSSSSSTAVCRCLSSSCNSECACRAVGHCKNDGGATAPAKRRRK